MATYLTPAEVKARSRADGIGAAADEAIEKLILEAESLVDAYCGFWEKADESQPRLFPRLGEETIPEEVKDATLATLENLFLAGAPSIASAITEERIGDYSYKKTTSAPELFPEKAKFLLRGFRKLTGKVTLKTE